MKRWEKAIEHKWRSKSAHAFLLYLNVADDFLTRSGTFEKLPEYLVSSTVVGKAHFTASFNRGNGIRFANGQEENFLKFLALLKPHSEPNIGNVAVREFFLYRRKFDYALGLFAEMLEISWNDKRKQVGKALDEYKEAMELDQRKASGPFFAMICEFTETHAPPNASTGTGETDRDSVVSLLVLARNSAVKEAGNLFVMTTDSLQLVAPALKSETNGIAPLKIEFPDQGDRETTIEALRKHYPAHKNEVMDTKVLAHVTAGMSRHIIGNLIKESAEKGLPIKPAMVFKKKKKFIEEASGNLLEVMQPLWGIKAIGGLEEHKLYIKEVVAAMLKPDYLAVPMGIMLLGAPGTGKTVFAQAVAYESELPFVKMKNTRNEFVGVSERNLDFSLELIRAQAPVVTFVDEIDQQYQARGGYSGDSGVSNRMQARLFEFMSDTDIRGKVLWIAASNKPGLMDPAMLREGRFDEKIPFFSPNAKERGHILEAILHKMKMQASSEGQNFAWDIPEEYYSEFGWNSHRHNNKTDGIIHCDPDIHLRNKEADDELAFTGAQIETIVRKAYTLASSKSEVLGPAHLDKTLKDYRPSHDIAEYVKMTEDAIRQCNSERFIPEGRWRKEARRLLGTRSSDSTEGTTIKLT
ncbi:MAG: ATP-binding protein [bacterium]|nr:ATP-binding protein [bacterium]